MHSVHSPHIYFIIFIYYLTYSALGSGSIVHFAGQQPQGSKRV